ncbi:MAG: response regulator [Lentisphaeraceae bacterium]|nr:response regulator [Lentisphaeraceae bacterium]
MYENIKLAVAEDDDELRNLIHNYLASYNMDIHSCKNGSELLGLIFENSENNFKPDIILTDLRMPGLNGMEFLRITHGINQIPPIILMTAFATSFTEKDALNNGAVHVITKPFNLESLLQLITDILDRKTS